jgi:hypothetical protein
MRAWTTSTGGVPLEDLNEQDSAWAEGWDYRVSRPKQPEPAQRPAQNSRSTIGYARHTAHPRPRPGHHENAGHDGWGGWGSNPGPADYESAALTG